VVLSSSSDGKSVNYRFISNGYALEDFVKSESEKGIEFYSGQDLGRRLKSLDIECSTLISIKEYRAIIQNDQNLSRALSNSKELKVYTRKYSLCDGRHSLRHIEKLIRAIHTKSGKMASIKTMVAAILEEDGIEPPSIKIKPDSVRNWAQEMLAVEDMGSRQEDMRRLSQLDREVVSLEDQLRENHYYFGQAQTQCQTEIDIQGRNKEKLVEKQTERNTQWANLSQELQLSISESVSSYRAAEGELDQIDARYQQYLGSDIEQIQRNLESLSVWQDQVLELEKQLQMLTDTHSDIEKTYRVRRAEIIENQSRQNHKENEVLSRIKTDRAQKIADHNEMIQKEIQENSAKLTKISEEYHQRLTELAGELASLKSQLQYMGETDEEKLEIKAVDQKLEDFDSRKKQLDRDIQKARTAINKAREDQASQLKAYGEACKKIADAEQRRDEALRLRFPQDGSLLHFLRTEQPGWAETIGRVIDPVLLERRDLKPVMEEGGHAVSFFGVQIDLKAIDPPAHCQNDAVLAEEVNRAEERLRLENISKEDIVRALEKATEQVDRAEESFLLIESEIATIARNIDSVKTEKTVIRMRHEAQLKQRKAGIEQEIDQKNQAQTAIQAEKDKELSDKKRSISEFLLELNAAHGDVIREIEDKVTASEQRLALIEKITKENLKDAEKWYQDTLLDRGIDNKRIQELEASLREKKGLVTVTVQRRPEVYEYLDWKAAKLEKRKPDLLRQVSTEKEKESTLKAKLTEAHSQYKLDQRDIEKELGELSKTLGKLHNNKKEVERLLQLIRNEGIQGVREADAEPIAINLMTLDEQVGHVELNINELSKKKTNLKNLVNQFDLLINKSGASKLSEAWERSRANHQGEMGQANYHQLVRELDLIFNTLLPQFSKNLLDEGRNYGIAIKSYYDVLVDINNKISAQASKITRHIEEDLILDGVSESSVRILSKISSLEYWDDLNLFMDYQRKWQESGYSELPEIEYIESIKNVAGILSRNTDRVSIINLLDIEIRLKEGNSHLVIRTDQEMTDSSSQGMAYLILCKFLLAFTRMLRGNAEQVIHWPIDELGTLHFLNIEKLFQACERNKIIIVGAFPNSDLNVLKLFENRYMINPKTRVLSIMRPQQSRLSERVEAMKMGQQSQETAL